MNKIVIIILALITNFCSTAKATVYYVDPSNSGSDANPGSLASPWATIQHAASTAIAGDSVYVMEAVYSEKVTFTKSGTASSFITFIGQGNVVVQGTASVTLWTGIFNINNKSYLRIKNFSLKNSYWFGIYVESSNNIYIENDSTYNTGASGISVWHSANVYAFNNVVRKACYQSLSTGSQECITFSGVSDFEIHHNEVFESGGSNNGGEGIDTKENCNNGKVFYNVVHDLIRLGIYADCWDKTLQNIEIFNNRVYNCSEGIVLSSENGGLLTNVKVYNNLTYNNINFGITISDYGTDGPKANISIMNNTIYKNGYSDGNSGWGGGIMIGSSNLQNITIFNNIVSDNDAMQISNQSGVISVSINKNLIYGYRGHNWTAEVKGTNVIEQNPLFSNPDGTDNIQGNKDDDFELSSGSPAINNGTNTVAPIFDYNHYARPADTYADMGAFEYNSVFLTTFRKAVNLSEIYPNPSVNEISVRLLKNTNRIIMYDEKGTIIKQYCEQQEGVLKISITSPGTYLIRIEQGEHSETHRIIHY